MKNADQASEESMEEILASIRKIIAEEEPAQPHRPAPQAVRQQPVRAAAEDGSRRIEPVFDASPPPFPGGFGPGESFASDMFTAPSPEAGMGAPGFAEPPTQPPAFLARPAARPAEQPPAMDEGDIFDLSDEMLLGAEPPETAGAFAAAEGDGFPSPMAAQLEEALTPRGERAVWDAQPAIQPPVQPAAQPRPGAQGSAPAPAPHAAPAAPVPPRAPAREAAANGAGDHRPPARPQPDATQPRQQAAPARRVFTPSPAEAHAPRPAAASRLSAPVTHRGAPTPQPPRPHSAPASSPQADGGDAPDYLKTMAEELARNAIGHLGDQELRDAQRVEFVQAKRDVLSGMAATFAEALTEARQETDAAEAAAPHAAEHSESVASRLDPAQAEPSALPAAPATPDLRAAAPAQASLEDGFKELLRPMLVQWLNDNMPRLLQQAIEEEVKRRLPPAK